MNRNMAALGLAAVALILSSSVESFGASPQSRMERGCFCVKPTGSAFRPYEIWMYPTQQFGNCAGLEVPSNFKEGPWERLLTCGELQSCLKISMQCEREKPSGEFPEALAVWKDRCALADYECFEQPFASRPMGETKTAIDGPPLEDILKNAEEKYKEVRKEAEQACGVVGRGTIKKTDFQECVKAKEALSEAQARFDKQKLDSIKLVRSLEKSTDALRRLASTTCSGARNGQKNCQKTQEQVVLAQKAFDETTNDIKQRLYGCKSFWQTPLECANITYEGAKLTLSDLGNNLLGPKPKPEIGGTGPIDEKLRSLSLKEMILAAKQDALSGHLKACKKTDGGFSCLNKEGQRYPVDYKVYKGWELAQGRAIKPISEKIAKKSEGQQPAKKEKKAEGVQGITQDVRSGFELANRLKDDLRDTAKWPSAKLNPSNVKNYDPDLRAKYEEQMRLANAIKSNPGANPADLAKALNIKSDPIGNLGAPPLNSKEVFVKPSGKSMKIVDRNGKLTDMNVFVCPRIQGFVTVEKNGVLYCQEAAKIAIKTVAAVKDAKSVTGYRIVANCAKTDSFHATNWAGKGTGECRPAKDDVKK